MAPLMTMAVGKLPQEKMGNARGLFNLLRNLGGSIGISVATTYLARSTQVHQANMVGHLTPYNPVFQQRLSPFTGRVQTLQRRPPAANAGLWITERRPAAAGKSEGLRGHALLDRADDNAVSACCLAFEKGRQQGRHGPLPGLGRCIVTRPRGRQRRGYLKKRVLDKSSAEDRSVAWPLPAS